MCVFVEGGWSRSGFEERRDLEVSKEVDEEGLPVLYFAEIVPKAYLVLTVLLLLSPHPEEEL